MRNIYTAESYPPTPHPREFVYNGICRTGRRIIPIKGRQMSIVAQYSASLQG
jgi:hypothetical protein